MLRNTHILFFILVLYNNTYAQTATKIIDKEILGKFVIEGYNTSVSLELEDNGNFNQIINKWSVSHGSEEEKTIGEYTLDGDIIIFKPLYVIKSTYYNKKATSDTTNFDRQANKFRMKLYVIRWDHTIYLLSDEGISIWGDEAVSDMTKFTNEINSGSKVSFINEAYWSRKCRSCYFSELSDALPPKWKEYILKTPIEATVTEVKDYPIVDPENETFKYIVTIDQGSSSGLKKGMKLFSRLAEECDCDLILDEVQESSSTGFSKTCQMDRCEVGTKMATFLFRDSDQ